jgi:hypothetical protein
LAFAREGTTKMVGGSVIGSFIVGWLFSQPGRFFARDHVLRSAIALLHQELRNFETEVTTADEAQFISVIVTSPQSAEAVVVDSSNAPAAMMYVSTFLVMHLSLSFCSRLPPWGDALAAPRSFTGWSSAHA